MNTLYLVRHGENTANITKEFSYKKVDYSLTPRGVQQSEQAAQYFKDKHIDEVYSSPLKRALETAQIIAEALGLRVQIIEELSEVNVGDLEGHPTAENWRFYLSIINHWAAGKYGTTFPGGENYYTLLARVKEAITRIVEGKKGKNIVISAHGGIFMATIQDICPESDVEAVQGQDYHNCAISELQVEMVDGEPRGRIIKWAEHAHLSGDAAELTPALPPEIMP